MGQRWRSTLSPVVVGTRPGAAAESRHVLVRHLASVVDEVHAADANTWRRTLAAHVLGRRTDLLALRRRPCCPHGRSAP